MIRTLVVDAARPARAGLRKMLSADPELDLFECGSGAEAIQILRAGSTQLVLLDIQMPGVDGFGVIEAVGIERMPVIVFTTAYSVHAIRAFEACALDYLLKPIGEERLSHAIARAKAAVRQREIGAMSAQLIALLESSASSRRPAPLPPTGYRFELRVGSNIVYLEATQVDWIESDDNYVRVWSAGRSHLVRETLQRLEQSLEGDGFRRVHRKALVNLARVREIRAKPMGRYAVVLHDGTTIALSRGRRATVQEALRARAAGRIG
jgi:two-component system LytT family response regulator